MALLRRVIGDALRARRQGQQRTLRDVSTAANVSLGYLSEIERGQKEASSELLAAICEALGSQVSEVLRDATDSLVQVERADAPLAETSAAAAPSDAALADAALVPAGRDAPHTRSATEPALAPAASKASLAPTATVTDGKVSVAVRRNGPFRTTLHAVPNRPRRPVVRGG